MVRIAAALAALLAGPHLAHGIDSTVRVGMFSDAEEGADALPAKPVALAKGAHGPAPAQGPARKPRYALSANTKAKLAHDTMIRARVRRQNDMKREAEAKKARMVLKEKEANLKAKADADAKLRLER